MKPPQQEEGDDSLLLFFHDDDTTVATTATTNNNNTDNTNVNNNMKIHPQPSDTTFHLSPSSTHHHHYRRTHYSNYGQHRQKHKIRFIFRSTSLIVLVAGYAIRNNYWQSGGEVGLSPVREDGNKLLRRRLTVMNDNDGGDDSILQNGKCVCL